jgi:hypothetical protein
MPTSPPLPMTSSPAAPRRRASARLTCGLLLGMLVGMALGATAAETQFVILSDVHFGYERANANTPPQTTFPLLVTQAWTPSTPYTQGFYVYAGTFPNLNVFLCTHAGTSSAVAGGPTLPPSGGTVADGTISWQYVPSPIASTASWAATTAYLLNQYIVNGGLLYQCSTAGTSAASGGPTGTALAAVPDGTAKWIYVAAYAPLAGTVYASWVTGTSYAASPATFVLNNGNLYQCTNALAGLSGATGPTGTGTGIPDGAVTWNFVSASAIATPPWQQSTAYLLRQNYVTDGANTYECTVGGMSLGSGAGPTVTSGTVADGSATWAYDKTTDVGNIAAPVVIGGVEYFDANTINQALLASLNQISGLTFPNDGGVNAGAAVGGIDMLAVTGDMANRYENNGGTYQNTVQIDATSWQQFCTTYFPTAAGGGMALKTSANATPALLLSPGNHDISNAIGYYDLNPFGTPPVGQDATSLCAMIQVATGGTLSLAAPPTYVTGGNLAGLGLSPTTYSEALFTAKNPAGAYINKPDYALTINGIHFISLSAWPDSGSRAWIDNDLASVPITTPVMLFTHCYPDVDTSLLTPNPDTGPFTSKTYQCVVSDKVDPSEVGSTGTVVEQLAMTTWIKTHPNIVAYFHGHTNFNEMYTYTGPNNDIALNCFRIDSPMKGQLSAAAPLPTAAAAWQQNPTSLLSFQLATINNATMQMTVREIRWYPTPAFSTDTTTPNPDTAVSSNKILPAANVCSKTVSLVVAPATASIPAGTYTSAQAVALSSTTPNTVIYYTSDGSAPAFTSSGPSGTTAIYSTPIAISANATIKTLTTTRSFSSMAPSTSSFGYVLTPTLAMLEVSRGAVSIAPGSTDAVTGSVAGASDSLTYTLANNGTEAETIVGAPLLTAKSNCAVVLATAPAASIGVAGSTTAVIKVTPVAAGSWSFTVAITDADPTNNPYLWTVSGTAGAAPGAALGVSRASIAIAPGGSDAVAGSLVATPALLTYALTNNGTAAETAIGTPALGSFSNCTATLTTAPAGSLTVGASTSAVITVTPVAAGAWSFTVSVSDSDPTNNPFTWTAGGTATVSTATGGSPSSSSSSSGCGHGAAFSMLMLSVIGSGLLIVLRRRA